VNGQAGDRRHSHSNGDEGTAEQGRHKSPEEGRFELDTSGHKLHAIKIEIIDTSEKD
jgi:hypothetical protein